MQSVGYIFTNLKLTLAIKIRSSVPRGNVNDPPILNIQGSYSNIFSGRNYKILEYNWFLFSLPQPHATQGKYLYMQDQHCLGDQRECLRAELEGRQSEKSQEMSIAAVIAKYVGSHHRCSARIRDVKRSVKIHTVL